MSTLSPVAQNFERSLARLRATFSLRLFVSFVVKTYLITGSTTCDGIRGEQYTRSVAGTKSDAVA